MHSLLLVYLLLVYWPMTKALKMELLFCARDMCASLTMGKRVLSALWQIVTHHPTPDPILAPFLGHSWYQMFRLSPKEKIPKWSFTCRLFMEKCSWDQHLYTPSLIVVAYWPSGKECDLRWGSSSTEAMSEELGKQGFFWKAVRVRIRVTTSWLITSACTE